MSVYKDIVNHWHELHVFMHDELFLYLFLYKDISFFGSVPDIRNFSYIDSKFYTGFILEQPDQVVGIRAGRGTNMAKGAERRDYHD